MSLILNPTVVEDAPDDFVISAEEIGVAVEEISVSPATVEGRPLIRTAERCGADFPVKIFVPRSGVTMGRSCDLGTGGMGFYVPITLSLDEEVHLHFTLPHSRIAFGIAGRVRDIDGYRYGAEFEGLTQSEAAELKRIVRLLGVKE
jgi:PilZ domain